MDVAHAVWLGAAAAGHGNEFPITYNGIIGGVHVRNAHIVNLNVVQRSESPAVEAIFELAKL
jgi:hypothetical protein